MSWEDKIKFNDDDKFDIQLSQALIEERALAEIFGNGLIEVIELKTESWQWERTGNIAIEYMRGNEPSGISVTTATCWVHQLKRDGETLCYLMFPIDRLKKLTREAILKGDKKWGGDTGRQRLALLRLRDLLR